MSALALQRIQEAKDKRLTRLDLGNCGLIELPDELFELTWLEELFLNQNILLSSLRDIGKLENIRILNLSHSSIENVEEINSLKKIKRIELYGCKISINDTYLITEIGLRNRFEIMGLTNHKKIKKLLWRKLKEDKKESEESLSNKNITELDLSGSKRIDFSNLTSFSHLESINLAHANISDVSFFSKLKKLKRINLSFTKVVDLTPLSRLYSLEFLSISFTGVNSLIFIKELRSLKELHINSTKINDLTPIVFLTNLAKLSINSTGIKDLSPLQHLHNLKEFYKTDCPIEIPPKEISDLGIKAIQNFFKQADQQKGYEELYEAKLIIVGEGGCGKTTLYERFRNPDFPLEDIPETHGINIFEGFPFKHKLLGDDIIFNANLWDFGGQELQYMTHQFFLTPRALYVLMMDARRESPNLAYWFKIISLLGRDSADSSEKVQVLLVFNKRGNTTGQPPQYQDILKFYADSLAVQYLEVDLAETDFRFENLQKTIQHSLVTLPIVKSQLPRLWKVVREDLRAAAKGKNYIDTRELSAICGQHGITEEADQWLLSGYLHQLGSLLHFQNDDRLWTWVILSPQWAVDGVYTFLSDDSIVRNNGRFTKTAFIQLLAIKKYSRHDANMILQLMTKNNFDICYQATEGNYVAAQLLPDNAPDYRWYPKNVLQFRYQYPIMPKGLMSRLIVRLSDDIERDETTNEQIVWKKGVILRLDLKEGSCRVRLREDDAESKSGLRQILIDVMGAPEARKRALLHVRNTVEDLHKKWFRSIRADEMVPCCCSDCRISETPQLYKLESLLKLRSKGHKIPARCYESAEEVATQTLLEGIYEKAEIQELDGLLAYRHG